MKYAVVQDGYAVFGIGDTREAAIADARAWGATDVDDAMPSNPGWFGGFYCARCTDALAKAVHEDGGDIQFWRRADGVVCLPDEDV